MVNKKQEKYFPMQNEREEVLLILRKHWFAYIAFAAIGLVMFVPLILLFIYWLMNSESFSLEVGNAVIVGGSAYLLIIFSLLLFGFIDYYLDVNIVTSERMVDIKQNGFFDRKISELSLEQIEDVSARVKGFFPTVFHFGQILIQTAGERENFMMEAIPHPYRVTKIILDLHDAAIEQNVAESAGIAKAANQPDFKATSWQGVMAETLNQNDPDKKTGLTPMEKGQSQQILSGIHQDEKLSSADAAQEKPNLNIIEKPVISNIVPGKKEEKKKKVDSLKEGVLDEGKEVDLDD